jgi:hypothetical protein
MRSSFHDISLVGMSVEHSREVRFVWWPFKNWFKLSDRN